MLFLKYDNQNFPIIEILIKMPELDQSEFWDNKPHSLIISPPGRAGQPAGQTGIEGHGSLLPGGGARQESEEEQADSAQPWWYSG